MKIDKEIYRGLTKLQIERAKLKAQGLKGAEIAEKQGVTPRAVYVSLQEAEKKMFRNLRIIKHETGKYKPSKKRRRRLSMFNSGMSLGEIAAAEGVSKQAIFKDLRWDKKVKENIKNKIVKEIDRSLEYRPNHKQIVNISCIPRNVVDKIKYLQENHNMSHSAAYHALRRYRIRQKELAKHKARLRRGTVIE